MVQETHYARPGAGRWKRQEMRLQANDRGAEVSAVLFDKDCTLLDSLSFWPTLVDRRVERLARASSLPADLIPQVYRAMGVLLPERRLRLKSPLVLGPRRDTIVAVATVLFLEGMDWDAALAAVSTAFATADAEVDRESGAPAFPGARPLLLALRQAGLRVGVLTNDDRERSRRALERAGLGDLVEAVAGGDEVPLPKPDPALLHLLCRRLLVDPRECAVVGDALSDVAMGKAAGVGFTVGVATGSASREELAAAAEAVVSSLEEIRVGGEAGGRSEERSGRWSGERNSGRNDGVA